MLAGGPPKSLPQAGHASTTTVNTPTATTMTAARWRRPARTRGSASAVAIRMPAVANSA